MSANYDWPDIPYPLLITPSALMELEDLHKRLERALAAEREWLLFAAEKAEAFKKAACIADYEC